MCGHLPFRPQTGISPLPTPPATRACPDNTGSRAAARGPSWCPPSPEAARTSDPGANKWEALTTYPSAGQRRHMGGDLACVQGRYMAQDEAGEVIYHGVIIHSSFSTCLGFLMSDCRLVLFYSFHISLKYRCATLWNDSLNLCVAFVFFFIKNHLCRLYYGRTWTEK